MAGWLCCCRDTGCRQFHAVFPSRRGLVPAVRAFIEFLAEELPGMTANVSRCYEDIVRQPDR